MWGGTEVGGNVKAQQVLAWVIVSTVVSLQGACGNASTQTSTGGQRIQDCDELAQRIPDLVVAAADHAANNDGGLPPAAFEADHPEDVGPWELTAALAGGSGDLRARVAAARDASERLSCPRRHLHETIDARVQDELAERGDLLSEEFDRDQYAAMNLMAIVTAAFQPAPSSSGDLPPGFPAEFPVHPGAQRVDADVLRDGSVTATWQVAANFDVVAKFYLDALQESRLGGWNVASAQGSGTATVEGVSTGRRRLEVSGYDFTGEVEIIGEDPGHVTITAKLTPHD